MKRLMNALLVIALLAGFAAGMACAPAPEEDALVTADVTETAADQTEMPTDANNTSENNEQNAQINKKDPNDPDSVLNGVAEWVYAEQHIEKAEPPQLGKYFANESSEGIITSYKAIAFPGGSMIGYIKYEDEEAFLQYYEERISLIQQDFEGNFGVADPKDGVMYFFVEKTPSLMPYYARCIEGEFVNN